MAMQSLESHWSGLVIFGNAIVIGLETDMGNLEALVCGGYLALNGQSVILDFNVDSCITEPLRKCGAFGKTMFCQAWLDMLVSPLVDNPLNPLMGSQHSCTTQEVSRAV